MLGKLERRYLFTGYLVLQTALHVGGGDAALGATDSPIIRSIDGQPFIPGSSLKGAFRSTVEKLAATLGLPNMDKDVLDTGSEWLKTFNRKRGDEKWNDETTIERVKTEWPATALLFGNPYTASKIFFADAMPVDDAVSLIQRRDGVAIDRDSERAMDRLKYDYEVVPPNLRFTFELRLENPIDDEVALTCLGLSEMVNGFFGVGGKRSSGLGRCSLEDFQVYALDLTTGNCAETLRRYLIGRDLKDKMELIPDGVQFINERITAFLRGGAQC